MIRQLRSDKRSGKSKRVGSGKVLELGFELKTPVALYIGMLPTWLSVTTTI